MGKVLASDVLKLEVKKGNQLLHIPHSVCCGEHKVMQVNESW